MVGPAHLPGDTHAELAQNIGHVDDVREIGNIGQVQRRFGQEASGHQWQRRILGPADRNLTIKPASPSDANAIHGFSYVSWAAGPVNENMLPDV
jgi:hypothetical protein